LGSGRWRELPHGLRIQAKVNRCPPRQFARRTAPRRADV